MILGMGDMSGNEPPEPGFIVPMRRCRIGWQPFAPGKPAATEGA
jgi:hypothetical protein